jgi:hypothetical protein
MPITVKGKSVTVVLKWCQSGLTKCESEHEFPGRQGDLMAVTVKGAEE